MLELSCLNSRVGTFDVLRIFFYRCKIAVFVYRYKTKEFLNKKFSVCTAGYKPHNICM